MVVALFFALLCIPRARAETVPTREQQIADVRADEKKAIDEVVRIVNQPVTHLKMNYSPGLVAMYSPGWFHEGAIKPDFDHVDVRQTQELTYASHYFVTSDLNPGEMFAGSELEFNSMTKYFYTDRSVPKKKLTEKEMLEINRLYRQIGADERKLEELKNPPVSLAATTDMISSHPIATIIVVIALAAAVIVFRTNTST